LTIFTFLGTKKVGYELQFYHCHQGRKFVTRAIWVQKDLKFCFPSLINVSHLKMPQGNGVKLRKK